MSQGPARSCLGPGRVTLGAHFGRVDGDQQPSRGSLLKTNSIVGHLEINSFFLVSDNQHY